MTPVLDAVDIAPHALPCSFAGNHASKRTFEAGQVKDWKNRTQHQPRKIEINGPPGVMTPQAIMIRPHRSKLPTPMRYGSKAAISGPVSYTHLRAHET